MLFLNIFGTKELAEKFEATKVFVQVKRSVSRQLITLQNYIKADKLSGQVLNVQSGTLRRSINQRSFEEDTSITGQVGSFAGIAKKDATGYAAIHEYGGRFIVPAYMRTTQVMFGKTLEKPITFQVPAHAAYYPQRSFMRSAFREKKDSIVEAIKTAIGLGLK